MKRIKTIESTVASLIKAFKSAGACIEVVGGDVPNSQEVTIFSKDDDEFVEIIVSDHTLPDCCIPPDYHLTTGNLDQVSYSTADWWRVAESVSGLLGYPIPRSVRIARSLHEKGGKE